MICEIKLKKQKILITRSSGTLAKLSLEADLVSFLSFFKFASPWNGEVLQMQSEVVLKYSEVALSAQ